MTDIFCPKCKSKNTTTQKAKQPDGTMMDNIIKVEILGTDMKSGETNPTDFHISYHAFMCLECNVMFAIADLTPYQVSLEMAVNK